MISPWLSQILASLICLIACVVYFCLLFFAKAMRVVSDIEECLQGKKSKTLPMSVKGQVHALIEVSGKDLGLPDRYGQLLLRIVLDQHERHGFLPAHTTILIFCFV